MTLEEIKDEYAINLAGYNTWDELINDEPSYRVEIHTDQVAERYAQSQTHELQEQNAELVEMLERAKLEFKQFRDAFGQGSLLINEIEQLILKHNKQ